MKRHRLVVGIFALLVVTTCCCGESRVSVADLASRARALAPFCSEKQYAEVPKYTCPPERCGCDFPMRPTDPFDEIPIKHRPQIQWVYSRRHLIIRVEPESSVLAVHRLAREYLHGEVTGQSPESHMNYYVVRLLSNARWDVSSAIVRAKKHKMIIDAGRASFPYPYERYHKSKNSQTRLDSIDTPR